MNPEALRHLADLVLDKQCEKLGLPERQEIARALRLAAGQIEVLESMPTCHCRDEEGDV